MGFVFTMNTLLSQLLFWKLIYPQSFVSIKHLNKVETVKVTDAMILGYDHSRVKAGARDYLAFSSDEDIVTCIHKLWCENKKFKCAIVAFCCPKHDVIRTPESAVCTAAPHVHLHRQTEVFDEDVFL